MDPALVKLAADRVSAARSRLLLTKPWYGSLSLRLKIEITDSVETMATNGTVLKGNPEWIASIPDAELTGVVAHEIMHCTLGHPYRMSGRNPERWNAAADYAINQILIDDGFQIPSSGLIDPRYSGMSAEQIYSLLPVESPNDPQPGGVEPADEPGDEPGSGSGTPSDEPGDEPGQSQSDSMSETDWQIAAEQAAMVARKAGSMGSGSDRAIRDSRQSVTDWREILRDFVAAVIPSDYSWQTPNRRYVSSGIYLPGIIRDGTPRIGIGVDTSGSISADLLNAIGSEITAIVSECRPEAIDVLYCDSDIRSAQTFTPDDEIKLAPMGGGGTRFQPVFDSFSAADNPPVAVIYITGDMLNSDNPLTAPDYPVLWVTPLSCPIIGSFGTTVRVNI